MVHATWWHMDHVPPIISGVFRPSGSHIQYLHQFVFGSVPFHEFGDPFWTIHGKTYPVLTRSSWAGWGLSCCTVCLTILYRGTLSFPKIAHAPSSRQRLADSFHFLSYEMMDCGSKCRRALGIWLATHCRACDIYQLSSLSQRRNNEVPPDASLS